MKSVGIWVLAAVLATAYAAPADEECDKRKCKGPLKYYDELSCKPIYEKEGDCCAVAYDCDHLKERSEDKCYYKGEEYKAREHLRHKLSDPCRGTCVCSVSIFGVGFVCTLASCGVKQSMELGLGCYYPRNATECCPGEPVCGKPEDVPTCEVGGRIYQAGDLFVPHGEPNKRCYCNEGYKGENVAPFCRTVNEPCEIEIFQPNEIANNYPPIYRFLDPLQTSCPAFYRYQNENDRVITPNETAVVAGEKKSDTENAHMKCQFGTLTLNRGDKLNPQEVWPDRSVECECQVPPTLTCIEYSSVYRVDQRWSG